MLSVNKIPVPNPEVVGRIVDNEAVLVLPGKGEVKVLNEVGARIWSLVDGRRSIEEIAKQIFAEFKVSQPEAEQDVADFIQQLLVKGIITNRID
jgi:hypothetical protein